MTVAARNCYTFNWCSGTALASDRLPKKTRLTAGRCVSADGPVTRRGFRWEHDELRRMENVVQDRVCSERPSRDLIRHGLTLDACRGARQLHCQVRSPGAGT
jgi:hypothetical protein